MRFVYVIAISVAGLVSWAVAPALAHHSFAAEYDASRPVTLKGKFVRMDWVNPHAWLHIDVANSEGKTESWQCEMRPPNTLYRNGWRKDLMKPGDVISVTGTMAKFKPLTMNARSVTTAEGRTLLAGSSESNTR